MQRKVNVVEDLDGNKIDFQGRLFKLSTQRGINSAEFVKIFMKSATA